MRGPAWLVSGRLWTEEPRVSTVSPCRSSSLYLRVQNFQSEEDSMDRTYKQDIPSVIKRLEGLRDAFATLDSKTDWTRLRIEPLLEHAKSLDRLIHARQFTRETTRLRRGVAMFHADLVYFRENLQGLKKVLESERKAAPRRG